LGAHSSRSFDAYIIAPSIENTAISRTVKVLFLRFATGGVCSEGSPTWGLRSFRVISYHSLTVLVISKTSPSAMRVDFALDVAWPDWVIAQ